MGLVYYTNSVDIHLKEEVMKLRKLLCSAVALVLAVSAFAATNLNKKMLPNPATILNQVQEFQNSYPTTGKYPELSQLEYLINGVLLQYENMPLTQPVPQENEILVTTAIALRAGLLNYAKELAAGHELTGQNAIIDQAFNEVPAILNQIKGSLMEVNEQYTDVLRKLAKAALANQNKVSEEETDVDVGAFALAYLTLTKAVTEGSLIRNVENVIMNEIQQLLMGE